MNTQTVKNALLKVVMPTFNQRLRTRIFDGMQKDPAEVVECVLTGFAARPGDYPRTIQRKFVSKRADKGTVAASIVNELKGMGMRIYMPHAIETEF